MFRQERVRLLIPAALIGLVVAAMLWWTMREDDPMPATPNAAVYGHVCAVAAAAKTGDGDEAERGFVDDAHGPLHELAASAGTQDRRTAGRLLEAKQRGEAALEADGRSEAARAELVTATRRAVEVADGDDPGPCR